MTTSLSTEASRNWQWVKIGTDCWTAELGSKSGSHDARVRVLETMKKTVGDALRAHPCGEVEVPRDAGGKVIERVASELRATDHGFSADPDRWTVRGTSEDVLWAVRLTVSR